MTGSDASPSFRLAYVPGVTPSKWVRIWKERFPRIPLDLVSVPSADAQALLVDGGADAGFVRMPAGREELSAIPLYTETSVVVIPRDHLLAAAEEVSTGDLAEDIVLHPLDDTLGWESLPGLPAFERPATTEDAVALVAAGIGLLVVPQSLARLHARKDLTYRPVTDAPESRLALAWPEEKTTERVEDFIGIVRGRTVNSSRGRAATPPQPKQEKRPASGGQRRGATAGKPSSRNPRGGSGGAKGAKSTGGAKGAKRGKPRGR
ncbi:LysR family substrate-binding domain-containing protein [Streptomyces sp. AM 2-1-1]|uniref:LysR family substrate-binding domain-containing protein n=1 Tax=Streptomyces sp. AM 2-1-1 TaxID=3028709 RepID=UPI0023B91703|nr:LysR family substrate-binding domain-containing protein [Streptomyces sp. AM 2-1-1]WEH42747.1 LysR family substrate-binding domain-containing protein [Streptomyces sp. AM 2-1-1]